MEAGFWHRKWERNEIAFHEGSANLRLVEHFAALSLPEGARVFVPLCGKTLDIPWLLERGCRVAGAELSETAVRQLFATLEVEPRISQIGQLKHYHHEQIDIFAGDLFDLSGDLLGPVDAVYDRAALVALPGDMRRRYAAHLAEITGRAPQLLICYEYDQAAMDGPPFSVVPAEVNQLYGRDFSPGLIATSEVPGGLKGKCAATESVWLLQPRSRTP